MRKKLIFLFAVLLLPLAGCLSTEEYLRAPRPAVQIQQLQSKIDALLTANMQRSVPLTGQYRQAIQVIDMDNNGVDEAILFLKDTGNERHFIYIFQMRDGQYYAFPPIEEPADSIHSVTFRDMNGDGGSEMIVGWQIGSMRSLSVYSLSGNGIVKILSQKTYSGYEIMELKEGDSPALMLLQIDPTGQIPSVVEMIRVSEDGKSLVQTDTARLSNGVGSLRRTRTGRLSDGVPALFVTCDFLIEDEAGVTEGEITDVFAYRKDGRLVNVSLQMESGVSDLLVRRIRDLAATDINGDGFLDLPRPVVLPRDPRQDEDRELYHQIEWITLDSSGTPAVVDQTFHSVARGWYYRIPSNWLQTFTVSRETIDNWDAVVIQTTFSLLTRDGTVATDSFFIIERIYKTSGHEIPDDEILLRDESTVCITAQICDLPGYLSAYQTSEEQLRGNFHFIESDWFYLSAAGA